MKRHQKIEVLGVPYDLRIVRHMPDNLEYIGLCNPMTREILIKHHLDDYNNKHTIKHELFHAYLTEAGFDDESSNEYLVNFLATQFEQIMKLFKKLGVLND